MTFKMPKSNLDVFAFIPREDSFFFYDDSSLSNRGQGIGSAFGCSVHPGFDHGGREFYFSVSQASM